MELYTLQEEDNLWYQLLDYASHCSWRAGISLVRKMNFNVFIDWERIVVAVEDNNIIGFCTITKTDSTSDERYMPYIGYIFVDEQNRGKRISSQMIDFASDYLKTIGFKKVHIVSDHINLYEKYGFKVVDTITSKSGNIEKIYQKDI